MEALSVGLIIGNPINIHVYGSNSYSPCVKPADGKWGSLQKDNSSVDDQTWDGLVGDLLADLGDVIVAPLDHTLQRAVVVDFCFGFISLGLLIMFNSASLSTLSKI